MHPGTTTLLGAGLPVSAVVGCDDPNAHGSEELETPTSGHQGGIGGGREGGRRL